MENHFPKRIKTAHQFEKNKLWLFNNSSKNCSYRWISPLVALFRQMRNVDAAAA
jgi:hypothetical protein